MAKGISLHIGLNYVNPDAYNGWDGALAGCVNDANDMKALAASRNFTTSILTNAEATSSKVVSEISNAARSLQSGDIFFISYSGHGGQIPDEEGNESDGFDETWVLYDRELIDNELYRLWSQFRTGVRIVVVSDSCHSGTIVKMFLRNRRNQAVSSKVRSSSDLLNTPEAEAVILELRSRSANMQRSYPGDSAGSKEANASPALRYVPFEVNMRDYMNRRDLYSTVQNLCGSRAQNPIDANLILISGCQDNQYSYDGDDNGYFTGKLLQVWNNGSFNGNYRSFHEEILAQMPEYQTPNFMKLGPSNSDFEQEKPFTIGSATAAVCADTSEDSPTADPDDPNPHVSGPNTWGRNSEPPTLSVRKGANAYYYVEVATENQLFDYQNNGGQRNANNFFATWNDPSFANNGRLTQSTFQLPDAVWQKLRSKNRLYYRIGTTSSLTKWEDFMITVANTAYADAPYIGLVDSSGAQDTSPQSTPVVLSKSVGYGGNNAKTDVKKVQQALNSVPTGEGGPSPKLTVDGLFGDKTGAAIKKFQNYHLVDTQNSGLIQPGSATLEKLGYYA